MLGRLNKRKSQKSLKSMLIFWFLLATLTPVIFITVYSIFRYQQAIDRELVQRLEGNGREISTLISDLQSTLIQNRSHFISEPGFVFNLSTNQTDDLKSAAREWINSDISTGLTFFNRSGRMLFSLTKTEGSKLKEVVPPSDNAIFISDENMSQIKDAEESSFVEMSSGQKISLILISKVQTSAKKTAGYVEQLIQIDQAFLNNIKNRMSVELAVVRNNGSVLASTHQDFYDYKKNIFLEHTEAGGDASFELTIRTMPFQFYIFPVSWGKTQFFIAVGASKGNAKATLKGVNYAFSSVIFIAIIMVVLAIFFISKAIIKPLDELVQATQDLPYKDNLIEIPITNETEIGLLTESFNQMSRQILRIRAELKAKIYELEVANKELKETQGRLVHSSKMSSLGQLVAGVAHELNNPISFIYSNMNHLKEYGDKLIKLAEAAEQDPSQVSKLKVEYEIDYIKSDLPKLIASCEDGARRVRDIVMGLRNFSRLDESKLKEIDVNEEIDNTLNLLAGEIKNRIQIHKYYSDLPRLNCFATQINQVFMNILSNAVQAIEGSGNIWITTKKIPGSTPAKDKISVSIQDSGRGIPQNVIDKIFDPFFSTKGVGQGTGLGLSISYGIMQNHGGDIQVKSQVGIGTEFIITVPMKIDRKKG